MKALFLADFWRVVGPGVAAGTGAAREELPPPVVLVGGAVPNKTVVSRDSYALVSPVLRSVLVQRMYIG